MPVKNWRSRSVFQQGNSPPLHVDLRFEMFWGTESLLQLHHRSGTSNSGRTGTLWLHDLHVRLHFFQPIVEALQNSCRAPNGDGGLQASGMERRGFSYCVRCWRCLAPTLLRNNPWSSEPKTGDCMRIDHDWSWYFSVLLSTLHTLTISTISDIVNQSHSLTTGAQDHLQE